MIITVTKRYVYVHLEDGLLIHRFYNAYDTDYNKGFERVYTYENPEIKNNRLYIDKVRERYTENYAKIFVRRRVSFPLKRGVIAELKK